MLLLPLLPHYHFPHHYYYYYYYFHYYHYCYYYYHHHHCYYYYCYSTPAFSPTVRPFFVRLPGDVTAMTGGEAILRCRAGGSPPPHVLWRRHDGRMPVGRARLDADYTLRITELTVDDAGVYICQAENAVATVVANATLTVYGKGLGCSA